MTAFARQYEFGKVAEGKIAKWLMNRGATIMPVYEMEEHTGKGPQMFAASGSLVAPDLFVFAEELLWIEAKHKTVFAWFDQAGEWRTGIDLHHYEDYQRVRQKTALRLWLLFLHESETPDALSRKWDSCPTTCPVGLFGQDIDILMGCEGNRDSNQGRHGMVYWTHDSLRLLAPISEFQD